MSKKRYTTTDQKRILAMVDVPHVRGRSYEEAEVLIEGAINEGKLPRGVSFASWRQVKLLKELGVAHAPDISKTAASELLDKHIPATEGQLDFLEYLGAVVLPGCSKKQASDLIDKYTSKIPMSDSQARRIAEMRGTASISMTYKDANDYIRTLSRTIATCKRCSTSGFYGEGRCSKCGSYLPTPSLVCPENSPERSTSQGRRQRRRPDNVFTQLLDWLGIRRA